MAIRSKIMGLFLLPWLWCGAMPGPAQSLRNEKAEEPKSSPVRLDASNPAEVLSWVDFKLPPDAEATTISAIALVEVTVNGTAQTAFSNKGIWIYWLSSGTLRALVWARSFSASHFGSKNEMRSIYRIFYRVFYRVLAD